MEISREAKFQKQDLDLALRFADANPEFDASFVNSLSEFYFNRGYLTEKQHASLYRVIEAWKMEMWLADQEVEP